MEDDAKIKAEQRRQRRLSLEIKFRYKIVDASVADKEIRLAFTRNISSTGLFFECDELIPIDRKLSMSLEMPGAPGSAVDIEGEVVRIEKLSLHSFGIGVNFTKVLEQQKEEINARIEQMDIIKLLGKVNREEISDLHLTAGSAPMVRRYGEIKPLDENPLSSQQIRQMVNSILSEEQKRHFEESKDLSFAFSLGPDSRFRVSIYQQRGNIEVVFRNIAASVKNPQELGLPDIVEELCAFKEGLVIIGGTTGSGKSTTIAAMIDIINRKRGGVILSLEKPIEYMHRNVKAIVKQREVGIDVPSFASGLKAALRQDPDVLVVGESLDSDTVETTLEAAETGHLIITSLHATDVVQVFDRIVSFFPLDQRDFIYGRLSHSLKAVVIQKLLPHKNGKNRVLAVEVCVVNTAVRRTIASGNFTQLPSIMQTGSRFKMSLMQDSVDKLFSAGLISAETYEMHTKDKRL